ncbi:MAG: sigma-E processing peptidase SpoIIGA [Clostridia bacterium]|nr:sigma-E processing peptidase SpoIIGA [Clostridia bacterium]
MYIEFVILDNFLLTYLAGTSAARLCHCKPCVWRMLAASAVGTAVAVFYPFMRINGWAMFAVKATLWAVLSAVMYAGTPRALTKGMAFLGCTFMFGGASYALGLIIYAEPSKAAAFTRKYPLFITLGTAAAVYCSVRRAVKRLRVPRARAPYEYGTQVEIFGAKLDFHAFLDTGNCVFDGKTGLPVVIVGASDFAQKLDGAAAVEFAKKLPELRTMTVRTPSGESEIFILQPSRITVYSDRRGHTINAMVGLVRGGNSFSHTHEMLLNPAAMTEGI